MLPRRSSSVCSFTALFSATEFPPREKRKAQIDGRRVEGIHGLGQVHAERFVAVKIAGEPNQFLGEVAVNAPVANLVGVGQRVARNLPPETHVIEFGLLGAQTGFDIAQAAAIGELSEQETKELIPTREVLDVNVSKSVYWQSEESARNAGT